MRDRVISRREALTLALAAAGTLVRPAHAAEGVSAVAQSATGSSGAGRAAKPGAAGSSLIIRNARPLDAEAPIEALRTFETRNDLFFVRSHHLPPAEPATPWTLTIDGDVARPLTLSLDELRRMRAVRQQRDARMRRQRPRPFRAAGDLRRAVGIRRGEQCDLDRRAARRPARTRGRAGVGAPLLDGSGRSQSDARGAEVPPQHSARHRARRSARSPMR